MEKWSGNERIRHFIVKIVSVLHNAYTNTLEFGLYYGAVYAS